MSDTWWASDPVADVPVKITVNKSPYSDAISSIESGGRYDLVGPMASSGSMAGSRPIGKYQVMEPNVGPWTEKYLGQRLTPQQFRASPDAQEAVFAGEFGRLSQKHGPEGAARAWFAGEGGMNRMSAKDRLGTTVAEYSRRFTNALKAGGTNSVAAAEAPKADQWWANDPVASAPTQQAAPQAPSMVDKTLEPITSYPDTYRQMNRESRQQIGTGIDQLRAGFLFGADPSQEAGRESQSGVFDLIKGVGNVAAGGLNYLTSPLNAAYRTVVGKPIEENTGIPKEYTEFAASLATPVIGLRAAIPRPPTAPAPAPALDAVTEAGRRIGVDVPRVAVSDSTTLQRTGGTLKEIPIVGDPLVKSSERAITQLDDAAKRTAAGYGSGDAVSAGEAARTGLTEWMTRGSRAVESRLYDRVDNLVNPNVAGNLTETTRVAQDILTRRANAKIPGESGAVKTIMDAATTPGGLNYPGIKDLRTFFRDQTPQELVALGINEKEAKAIYGALTKDLRGIVQKAGGPQATSAFDKANNISAQINTRRESLAKVIGLDGNAPPERVLDRIVQMASTKGNADLGKLTEARKSIGADRWNEVASAVIQRMGHSAAHPEFSGDKFVTAYNALSPAARRVLFNSTGRGDLARALDDIAAVSTVEKAIKRFGNPSRSGSIMTGAGAVVGGWAAPSTVLPLAIGGNVFARVLASPRTVQPAAQWSNAHAMTQLRPTSANYAKLSAASRALALAMERNLGLDAQRAFDAMQGVVRIRADEEPRN